MPSTFTRLPGFVFPTGRSLGLTSQGVAYSGKLGISVAKIWANAIHMLFVPPAR